MIRAHRYPGRRWFPAALRGAAWAVAALLIACAGPGAAGPGPPPEPELAAVPAGPYVRGSDRAEREAAYLLDEAAYGRGC